MKINDSPKNVALVISFQKMHHRKIHKPDTLKISDKRRSEGVYVILLRTILKCRYVVFNRFQKAKPNVFTRNESS